MNSVILLPVVIPLLLAALLIFVPKHHLLQKGISLGAILLTLGVSIYLVRNVSESGIQIVQVGGWAAPFGIIFVADMFSALLVVISSIVAACCLLYAFGSIQQQMKSYYFYSFFLFLIAGVNGSFLTGDLFNLFVCFELMLISSYVLLGLGSSKKQFIESIKYVLINVIASMLFVIAISYLYAITGTLNMADLSMRIAEAGQDGLITTVSLLFLTVFGLKAALFLYYWLPGAYSAPPPAVSALFAALLTKVGVYSIFRMFTLIFYHQPDITHTLIIWLGAATMILGAIGAVAYWDVKKIITYNVIVAVGFILFGLGLFTDKSIAGAIFYLMHDMIVKALLFITAGAVVSIAGTHKLKEISGLIAHHPYLGWLFFLTALSLAGIPPLSGFIGKVMVTQGALEREHYIVGAIGILSSLFILYSVMKIFLNGFWGESILSEQKEGKPTCVLLPCTILAAMTIFIGLGGDWIFGFVDQASHVLMNPHIYVDAVLNFNS